jgi:UDP:flavonoid glycosyltransferase YjiC (YdhE family)
MLVIAEFLRNQGYDVLFNSSDLFREKAEAKDLRFFPLVGNANYDWQRVGELIPQLRNFTSPAELFIAYVKHMLGDRIPDQYREVRRIIDEEDVDLVMTDSAFYGVFPLLLRDEPRPPVISCGTIAPLWHDPASSELTGPDNTPEGRERNREYNRRWKEERLAAAIYIDEVLATLGAHVPGGFDVSETMYRLPDLFLQLGAEAFEYPLYEKRPNLRFTGPLMPRLTDPMKAPVWLDQLDGTRPVIFVTQGTLANYNFDHLVNPALAGLAEEDVQVVVTAGGGDAGGIVLQKNSILETYLPYDLIFPKTSVFVTNGGYNGVQQALCYGVPIVSAGATEDKPRVGARVAWSGVGMDLKTGQPTAEQIRNAVRGVLQDRRYRDRAKMLGASIAHSDALTIIAQSVKTAIADNAGCKA